MPLISYLVLGGRCRAYGRRKSPRYFVVELLTALLAAALYYQFGLGVAFLVGFVYVAALIVISFIDLDVRIVPDIISLSGIVVGLLYSVVGRYLISDPLDLVPTPVSALTGAVAGREFLLAVAWLYERVRGAHSMGRAPRLHSSVRESDAYFTNNSVSLRCENNGQHPLRQ